MSAEYLPRVVDELLAERLAHHAAVPLVGPRATGKTTTAGETLWDRDDEPG
jgi:hypothetical protein